MRSRTRSIKTYGESILRSPNSLPTSSSFPTPKTRQKVASNVIKSTSHCKFFPLYFFLDPSTWALCLLRVLEYLPNCLASGGYVRSRTRSIKSTGNDFHDLQTFPKYLTSLFHNKPLQIPRTTIKTSPLFSSYFFLTLQPSFCDFCLYTFFFEIFFELSGVGWVCVRAHGLSKPTGNRF